jgi:hypothetical protein
MLSVLAQMKERGSASLVRVGVAVAEKRAKQMIFSCEGLDVCLVIYTKRYVK